MSLLEELKARQESVRAEHQVTRQKQDAVHREMDEQFLMLDDLARAIAALEAKPQQADLSTCGTGVEVPAPEGVQSNAIPEGFTAWGGGEQPVGPDVMVECVLRNDERLKRVAGDLTWEHSGDLTWEHSDYDIIAYRVIEPAQVSADECAAGADCPQCDAEIDAWRAEQIVAVPFVSAKTIESAYQHGLCADTGVANPYDEQSAEGRAWRHGYNGGHRDVGIGVAGRARLNPETFGQAAPIPPEGAGLDQGEGV